MKKMVAQGLAREKALEGGMGGPEAGPEGETGGSECGPAGESGSEAGSDGKGSCSEKGPEEEVGGPQALVGPSPWGRIAAGSRRGQEGGDETLGPCFNLTAEKTGVGSSPKA